MPSSTPAVAVDGVVCDDPFAEINPENFEFSVDGEPWRFREHAYLLLNKPSDFECSQKPRHHPSVYTLLPRPLVTRGVQAVGRLDGYALIDELPFSTERKRMSVLCATPHGTLLYCKGALETVLPCCVAWQRGDTVVDLDDADFVARSYDLNRAGMAQILAALARLGIAHIPSHGNFLTFKVEDAAAVNQKLLRQGVIVRPLAGYQMPDWLRVTIGTESENARFIDALEKSLA